MFDFQVCSSLYPGCHSWSRWMRLEVGWASSSSSSSSSSTSSTLLPPTHPRFANVISFVIMLTTPRPNSKTPPSPPDSETSEAAQVLFLCGKLAGSVKKWNRGDQSWQNFRPRIQKNVSDLLGLLSQISPVPLEVAMKKNIEKILSRRERKVVLGDGSER